MTPDNFPTRWPARIIELAKLLGAISIITGFFGGLWAFTWGPVGDFLDQWAHMQSTLVRLSDDVRTLKGEDRVIRQPPGQSYVEEPVHQGENVVMVLVVARTRLGANCRLTEWVPIFTDDMAIPTPGHRAAIGPVRQQVGTNETRMRVEMVPPKHLRPGRVTVYLALTYRCPGAEPDGIVPDRTDVIPFELLPA